MKYNTLVFKLDKEEGTYVFTDIISYHTMWQDYSIDPIPVKEIAEHGIKKICH